MKKDTHHYVLATLLVVFIVSDAPIPGVIGELVDTVVGKIVVVMIALSLFGAHPVVGAIGLVAAYQVIMRSQGLHSASIYIPSERKKSRVLTAMNQFPVTIEEEVIFKQIPYVFKRNTGGDKSPYKGVQDKLYGAAKLTE
uniref:Uncharacterized protein n=1 Tax=viral metagenome TaxID=1070528 RepID=A0A6C0C6H3_9ZZZZ